MSTRLSPNIKLRPTPPSPDALVLRWATLQHKLTDDDFFALCQQNRNLRIEMTKEGDMIVMMPTGGEGGNRNYNLIVEFGIWAKQDGTGVGFDSSTGFKLPNGAKRSPDLSWIQRKRWTRVPKKLRKKFPPICPDFVVELRSETDDLEVVQAKMEEYLENGAQLGWLLDPLEKKVHIYRPNEKVKLLNRPKTISGEPLLQGLKLKLAGILD
ncbi:MAG: Uma2 family endonuclease [Blastocatellia bacterium]|nr:Uma2 family endonuclease [Blastocatellia bacterium]